MTKILPLSRIEDWEKRIERQDAFWDRGLIDRPVCCMSVPKAERSGLPSHHEDYASRWLDAGYQAERAALNVQQTLYLGDALPICFPDLGPDYFSACYGGTLRFMDETSYIEPFVDSLGGLPQIAFPEGEAAQNMERLYEALLALSEGEFYVGWPDLHGGGDALVGMVGPMQLSYDVIDTPDLVKQAVVRVTDDFIPCYEYYHEKLKGLSQPVTGWPGIVSSYKWHAVSNDFSGMISTDLFEELFLDDLLREIRSLERSIYHLDGPGALRHLDLLLSIDELDAIQWVYGAGNGRASDHIPVYKRIQQAGKAIQIVDARPDELDMFTQQLEPEGVWIDMRVKNQQEADYVLKRITEWR